MLSEASRLNRWAKSNGFRLGLNGLVFGNLRWALFVEGGGHENI